MVMRLKTFCCGCTLRTGSLVIGILSGLAAFIQLVSCIIWASAISGELQKEISGLHPQLSDALDERHKSSVGEYGTIFTVVFSLLAVMSGIHLLFSILLVFGTSSEKPKLLKPWIIYSVVMAVLAGILAVILIIFYMSQGLWVAGLLYLLYMAFVMCIHVYFILIVNSFYHELMAVRVIPNKM